MPNQCCMSINGGKKHNDDHQDDDPTPPVQVDISTSSLTYGLTDVPPVAVVVMAALQHILVSFPGVLSTTTVVADAACVPLDHHVRSNIFSASIFMVGLASVLQTCIGVNLPIFQGASSSFLVPLLAMANDPDWDCGHTTATCAPNSTNATQDLLNSTNAATQHDDEMIYKRLQEMSGALILASLVEVVMGGLGLMNLMVRYMGPIPIGVTIAMIGVSLVDLPLIYGRSSYPLSFGCLALVLIFIFYLGNVPILVPRCRKRRGESRWSRFYIFTLIPIMLAMLIMWIIIAIMTSAGAFPDDPDDPGYMARSDVKTDIIKNTPWFHVTYPGQFGAPSFNNVALTVGFAVACMSSFVESVGDYYATHMACEVPKPPNHAVARGILVEGLVSVLSGAVGAGHATTSYSSNVAVLKLSKTGSRRVMYAAGFFLIFVSLIGKIGAAFTTIPAPVLGGAMMVLVAAMISIGVSTLMSVDMSTTRNLLVVGTPIAFALLLPRCLEMYPELFQTGNTEVDRVIRVLVGTSMFVGGVIALFLDNTVPDPSKKTTHRNISHTHSAPADEDGSDNEDAINDIYSWKCYPRIRRALPFLKYVPFLPPEPSERRPSFL